MHQKKNRGPVAAMDRHLVYALVQLCLCQHALGSRDPSPGTRSVARRNANYDPTLMPGIVIQQFHLTSQLHSRFATVTIDSEVVNKFTGGSREAAFTVQVPEAAFMRNFSMTVAGQHFSAIVLPKEEAQERYNTAKERNQTAGMVKQESVVPQRGMQVFTVMVSLPAGSSGSFQLIYSELLERRRGTYTQKLFLQPGGIVANMTVRARFAETEGFKTFTYKLPGDDMEQTSSSENVKLYASPTTKELIFTPPEEMQRNFDATRGMHGEFVIVYDVVQDTDGGVVIIQNDHFVHFFAPPGLRPLPKNILFIIDISGSMEGEKIRQARDAMLKIIDDLVQRELDTFNILLFNDKFERWQEGPRHVSMEAESARNYVREKLVSRGATDIHQALKEGLKSLLGEKSAHSCDKADMIIFLTDGDPTSGVTNIERIVSDTTILNNGRAAIYSLGFGFSLNFDFLSVLSERNGGFARRIYAESDAAQQLENFYAEISTPVLCNVTASYGSNLVESGHLTVTNFPLYFLGKEIVVAGETKTLPQAQNGSAFDARVQGFGTTGLTDLRVRADKVMTISESDTEADLTEKLWAYMKIKNLLSDMARAATNDDQSRIRQEALQLSLKYGFVTPLTSFSVVVDLENPLSEYSFDLNDYLLSAEDVDSVYSKVPVRHHKALLKAASSGGLVIHVTIFVFWRVLFEIFTILAVH